MAPYFESPGKLLDQLIIESEYLGSAMQALRRRFEEAWNRGEWTEADNICGLSLRLLSEERVSRNSAAISPYPKGVFRAYKGAVHWANGKLKDAKDELDDSAQCFLNSGMVGHYNAGVVNKARGDVLVQMAQKVQGDTPVQRDQLRQAVKIYQQSLLDLDNARAHFSRDLVSLRQEEVLEAFERICENLCQPSFGGTEAAAGTHQRPGPQGNADGTTETEQRQSEQSMPLLSMIFGFAPVVSDPISAGQGKSIDDKTRTLPSIESVFIDDELCFIRPVELGQGQKTQLTLDPTIDLYFIAEVEGESMKGLDIHSGDYVWLRRPRNLPFEPESGSVVAAVIRGEDEKALLKRYLCEGSTRILKPENSDMESFEFTDLDEVEFVGEAVAILKKATGPSEPSTDEATTDNSSPNDPKGKG